MYQSDQFKKIQFKKITAYITLTGVHPRHEKAVDYVRLLIVETQNEDMHRWIFDLPTFDTIPTTLFGGINIDSLHLRRVGVS